MKKKLEKCIKFLEMNGFEKVFKKVDILKEDEYISFRKEGRLCLDINEKEIVLIDDTGDFLHLLLNYYALIGALIHFGLINTLYKY